MPIKESYGASRGDQVTLCGVTVRLRTTGELVVRRNGDQQGHVVSTTAVQSAILTVTLSSADVKGDPPGLTIRTLADEAYRTTTYLDENPEWTLLS